MVGNELHVKSALKNAFAAKSFEDFGDGLPARVYLTENKQVYYLLDKGDVPGSWSLQFWIDSYATDRLSLQEKLAAIVSANSREYDFLSYYNARGCRRRTRVMDVNDLEKDLACLREFLSCFEEESEAGGEREDDACAEGVGIAGVTVSELLKLNLRIPKFQRAYCWEAGDVQQLLNDVSLWQNNNKGKDDQYHIGTVVLKKTKQGEYDIIDGQQRITTLCMYAILNKCQVGEFDLGSNNHKVSALKKLTDAAGQIKSWNANGKIDLARVAVSAVIIGSDESDDLAFGFFNHLNSSGKPLSDYDLLKSHHLRYIEGDSLSAMFARRWNGVEHDMLHLMLFRIRHWLRSESFSCQADTSSDRELFNEFKMVSEPLKGICTTQKPMEIDSLLSDGLPFFDYVGQYERMYEFFKKQEVILKLEERLLGHSYGTLCLGIKALAFLFFCRFGDAYLKEAVYAIAYGVSRIRNEYSVKRDYISTRPEFPRIAKLIRHATHEGEVLGGLLDANRLYSIENMGGTANAYWNELKKLGEFAATEVLKNKEVIKQLDQAR